MLDCFAPILKYSIFIGDFQPICQTIGKTSFIFPCIKIGKRSLSDCAFVCISYSIIPILSSRFHLFSIRIKHDSAESVSRTLSYKFYAFHGKRMHKSPILCFCPRKCSYFPLTVFNVYLRYLHYVLPRCHPSPVFLFRRIHIFSLNSDSTGWEETAR